MLIGEYLTFLIDKIWFDLQDKQLLRIILLSLLARFGWVGWMGFSIFCTSETQSDLRDMDLPIYPRSAYGPNGPSFWVGTEGPRYCLGYTIPLGLASGLVSLFSSPHQLPPALVYGMRGQGL